MAKSGSGGVVGRVVGADLNVNMIRLDRPGAACLPALGEALLSQGNQLVRI